MYLLKDRESSSSPPTTNQHSPAKQVEGQIPAQGITDMAPSNHMLEYSTHNLLPADHKKDEEKFQET